MSAENVELTRKAVAAMATGDYEAILALCAPDVEFVPILAAPLGAEWRGLDGMARWFSMLEAAFESFAPEPDAFEDHGDTVLVLGHTTFSGWDADGEVRQEWGVVCRWQKGKIVWWKLFPDPHDARLEAAGGAAADVAAPTRLPRPEPNGA